MFLVKNVTVGHGGHVFVQNIQLSLDSKARKRIAVVGTNGCGKSSLIKTLIGENQPLSGSIQMSEETLGYLPQIFEFEDDAIVEEYLISKLEESWMDYLVDISLDQVGLDPEVRIKKISHLSGGQKMRLKLAEILLQSPTILVLDEPTNHLDAEGFAWLQKFLEEFDGTVILVSHNRKLLSESINTIWEMNTQTHSLDLYPGNYEDWQVARERNREQQMQQFNKINDEILELKAWLKENEFHPRFRFSDRVMSQKKKIAQLEEICPERPMQDIGLSIKNMNNERQKLSRLFKFDIESKTFVDRGVEKTILKNVSGSIYGNEVVQIVGPNGSGKSTLLRILAGEEKDFKGTIIPKADLKTGWLRQECLLPKRQTVYETVIQELNCTETRAFQLLDHYRLKEVQKLRIDSLSGGQQKKLELALILEHNPEIVFLDEPTNHLDIFVQKDLEDFLLEAQNITLLFVSHDEYFSKKMNPTKFIELS